MPFSVSNSKLVHTLTRGAMIGFVEKVIEFLTLFNPGQSDSALQFSVDWSELWLLWSVLISFC